MLDMNHDEFEKLLEKLDHMTKFWEYNDTLALLYKVEKDNALKHTIFFNYGYMMGVRAERERRAKRKANN